MIVTKRTFALLFILTFSFGFLHFNSVSAQELTGFEGRVLELPTEQSGRTAPALADELIIRYKNGTSTAERLRFRNTNGLKTIRSRKDTVSKKGIERVRVVQSETPEALQQRITDLKQDPRIEYVEPNTIRDIQSATPNDTDYFQQWTLPQINVPSFWETTTGSEQVKVAVLDTGLDFTHTDKPIHLLQGYNFVNDDTDPTDDHGHGTYIAGVIAAHSDNANGITGLCWNCSILPVKVMNQYGKGTDADVANGIIWATDQGADIINLSVGGYAYSQTLLDAVTYAQQHDVLVIAAGGNHGIPVPMYPANYPDVIGVSATDSNNELWSGSNTGEHIDLAAPGVNVYGLGLNNTYSSRNGSSVATAHVTGIAALLLSDKLTLTNNQITQSLFAQAEDLGVEGKDEVFGVGLSGTWNGTGEVKVGDVEPTNEELVHHEKAPELAANNSRDMNILSNRLNLIYSKEYVQEFLNKQPGKLKNYVYRSPMDLDYSAADLLTISNEGPGYSINPQVLTVFMELLSNGITNLRLTERQIGEILEVDQDYHDEVLKRMSVFSENEDNENSTYPANTLTAQIGTIATELGFQQNCFSSYKVGRSYHQDCQPTKIIFKDGSAIPFESEINAETYAVQSVLAKLTIDKREWQKWTSKEEGSFYDLFERWFGKPNRTPSNLVTLADDDPVEQPFLTHKPYEDTDFVNLNSYFDHEYPNYSGAYVTGSSLLNFMGQTRNNASNPECYLGYDCYSDHDGIDYGTQEEKIFAAGNGVVLKVKDNTIAPNPYGNVIYITHYTNDDAIPDYISIYAHLANSYKLDNGTTIDFGENLIKDSTIIVGNLIGESAGTGADCIKKDANGKCIQYVRNDTKYAPHLHFSIRKIIKESDGTFDETKMPETHHLVDPYGWWGQGTDPADNHGSGSYKSTASTWLWKNVESPLLVDNKDVSFQHFANKGVGALWNEKSGTGAYNNHALYTFAVNNPERKWDDWAFWVGNMEKAGQYVVRVHIPDYTPIVSKSRIDAIGLSTSEKNALFTFDGKTATFKIGSLSELSKLLQTFNDLDIGKKKQVTEIWERPWNRKAHYTVYHKGGTTDIEIDQNNIAKGSQWITLCNPFASTCAFGFEKGVKAAVRLVDEVNDNKMEQAKVDQLLKQGLTPEQKNQIWELKTEDAEGGGQIKFYEFKHETLSSIHQSPVWSGLASPLQNAVEDLWNQSHNEFKVIWADAVRWISASEAGANPAVIPTPLNESPDLEFKPSLLKIIEIFFKKESFYEYVINVVVKNTGTIDINDANVCFDPFFGNSTQADAGTACEYNVQVGFLGAGEEKEISLPFFKKEKIPSNASPVGTLSVGENGVSPLESKNAQNNNTLIVTDEYLTDENGDGSLFEEPGGIDLSSAQLGGIQIDPTTNHIQFVLKGDLAKDGEQVIDLSATRSETAKLFLQALAVPNYKHQISLDIIPDGDQIVGKAWVPDPFERTDLADVFLKADVAMKFDVFGDKNTEFQPTTEWTNLVKASPYWEEISSKGFGLYPDYVIAATIVPGQVEATQTGNDFFLENVKLDINAGWWMREPSLVLDGLGLSSGAKADLEDRLQTFKAKMETAIKNRALNFTLPEMNGETGTSDPRFEKLRSIFAVVSAAQWYKVQVKNHPELPYASLIDSENLSGIGSETPFDSTYWDSQAYQQLGAPFDCQLFAGEGECSHWGGLKMENSTPIISGPVTTEQKTVLIKTLDDFETVESEGNHYVYGGTVLLPEADLTVGQIDVNGSSDNNKFLPGQSISLDIALMNSGPVSAQNVMFKLYDQVTSGDSKMLYTITQKNITSLAGWEELTEHVDWVFPNTPGLHTLVAEIDYLDKVKEMNEMNNISKSFLEVVEPHLDLFVVSPQPNTFTHPGNITFQAVAYDHFGNLIEKDSAYTWFSDLTGTLGIGDTITVSNMSEGDHSITLSVDDQGLNATKTLMLYIKPMGSPLPKILLPLNDAAFTHELIATLQGEAMDNEDGSLSGTSLVWFSNLDGELGVGNSISVKFSLGEHIITLKATDSDGQTAMVTVNVNVSQGIPLLTILAPESDTVIPIGETISFSATAKDEQQGDLNNKIQWFSNIDGLLGQGADFKKILSAGVHIITASVVDSDGLQASAQRTITVQNTVPDVVISTPADSQTFDYKNGITFIGEASDAQDGVIVTDSAFVWTSDRDGVIGIGKTTEATNLSPGAHTITLSVKDDEGGVGTAILAITIDAGEPTVSILQPADGSAFTFGKSVILEAAATDKQDGVLDGESVKWFSDLDGLIGTGANLTVSTLSVGMHNIRVEAVDSQGWKKSITHTITIQPLQPPQVTILFPKNNGQYVAGEMLYFYGLASDTEDGLLSGTGLSWMNADGQAIGDGSAFSSNDFFLGSHTITFTATDSDGLSASTQVTFSIIPAAPLVSIISPTDGTLVKIGDPITFTGQGANNLNWQSNVDGELGTGASLDVNNLSKGSHLITLTATDDYGQKSETTITVAIIDETSMALQKFSSSELSQIIDFSGQKDHTLNIILPKDAIVDNAQVTLAPTSGLGVQGEEVDVMGEEVTENEGEMIEILEQPELPTSEEYFNGIKAVSLPQDTPIFNQDGKLFDVDSEDKKLNEGDLSVLSPSFSVGSNHAMSSILPGGGLSLAGKNYFYSNESAFNTLILGNGNAVPLQGSIKWVFKKPNQLNLPFEEAIQDVSVPPYSVFVSLNSGYNLIQLSGEWSVDFYSKSQYDADWVYHYTDIFEVHETPNLAPVVETAVWYTNGNKENSLISVFPLIAENATLVEYAIHWNSGAGWFSQVHTDPQKDLLSSVSYHSGSPNYVTNYTNKGFVPFSLKEGDVVQYYATATDFEGNVGQSATNSFSVSDSDTTGPTVNNIVVSEGEGADGNGVIDDKEKILLTVYAEDIFEKKCISSASCFTNLDRSSVNGVATVDLVVDGQSYSMIANGNNYSVTLSPLSAGTHNYSIIATDDDTSPENTTVTGNFVVTEGPTLLNPSLDAGADGLIDWSFPGDMKTEQVTTNFALGINAFIQNNPPVGNNQVTVPLQFHADKGNFLNIKNLNISYHILDTTPPVIDTVSINPTSPQAGQPFTITVTASDDVAIKAVSAEVNQSSVSLSKNADVFTGSLVIATAGSYELSIKATDESGLITTQVIPLTVVFNGSELSVKSVTFTPKSPLLSGQTAQADVLLSNAGNQTVDVQIQFNHVMSETKTVTLPANNTVSVSTSFTLPVPGDYAFEVVMDPANAFPESDETNNTFSYSYKTIDGVPPVFEQVTVPKKVSPGEAFIVKVQASDNEGVETVQTEWMGQTKTETLSSANSLSLKSYWSFDEGGGTVAIDKIGSNNGVITGASYIKGISGNALSFDGITDDVLTTLDIDPTAVPNLTISLWIFPTDLSGSSLQTIASADDGGWDRAFGILESTDTIYVNHNSTNVDTSVSISENEWTHIVVQYLTDNLYVYKNGVLEYSLGSAPINSATSTGILMFGQANSFGFNFQGYIDEPRVFSYSLTQNNVSALYQNPGQVNQQNPEAVISLIAPDQVGNIPLILTVIDQSGLSATMETSIEVIKALPNPLIQIGGISTHPENIMPLEIPDFEITLRNNGGTTVDAPLRLEMDGQVVSEQIVTIPLGSPTIVKWSGWQASVGIHLFTVMVDPDNLIAEQNESDNTAVFNFTVFDVLPPQLNNLIVPAYAIADESFEILVDVIAEHPIDTASISIGDEQKIMTSENGTTYHWTGALPLGNYPFVVSVSDEKGASALLPGEITVHSALSDLTLDTSFFSFSGITNKDVLPLSVAVHNDGLKSFTAMAVSMQLDGVSTFDEWIDIPAGETIPASFTAWKASAGFHTVVFSVDPANSVEEADETNNTVTVSFSIADVTPPSITNVAMPDVLYAGELFLMTMAISDDQLVAVTADWNSKKTDLNVTESAGSYTIELTAPMVAGTYPLNLFAENGEGLVAKWSGILKVLPIQPDLTILGGDVSFVSSHLVEGEMATLLSVIHNKGGSDMLPVSVVFMSDDVVIDTKIVSVIKGGESTLQWKWIPSFGAHKLSLSIDPDHLAEESDETNNMYTLSVYAEDNTPPSTPKLQKTLVQSVNGHEAWKISWLPVMEANLKTYDYQFDGGIWMPLGLETFFEIDLKNAGQHLVCARAKDIAGNMSGEGCVSFLSDFDAPNTPLLQGGTAGYWSNQPKHTFSWNTPLDDVAVHHYLLKVNDVISNVGLVNQYVNNFQDGIYSAQVAAVDVALHQSDWSNVVTTKIDTSVSGLVQNLSSETHPDFAKWYANGQPSFNWQSPEDLSGIQYYYYYIDQNPNTILNGQHWFTPDTQITIPNIQSLKTGVWYFHIAPMDGAGNTGLSAHFKIQVDLSPPYTKAELKPNSNIVLLEATDEKSGIGSTHYRLDDGEWQTGFSVTIPTPNTHTIEYYSIDTLDNQESIKVIEINLKKPSSPTVDPVPNPIQALEYTLTGTKPTNTSLWINDKMTIAPKINTKWSHTVDITGVENTFVIYSKDSVDLKSESVTVQINYQTSAPTVDDFVQPVTHNPLTLTGTKAPGTSVWINDKKISGLIGIDNADTWESNVILLTGMNTFTIVAKTDFGAVSTPITLNIPYNIEALTVDPVPDVVYQTHYTLTGIKPANTGLWINDKEIIPVNSETSWSTIVTLSKHENKFTIFVKDSSGNQSALVAQTILYEVPAPFVSSVMSPVYNPLILTGIKSPDVVLWLNGKELSSLSSATTWKIEMPLEKGVNTFDFVAKNEFGMESQHVFTSLEYAVESVVLDTKPTISSDVYYTFSGAKPSHTTLWVNDEKISVDSEAVKWTYTAQLTAKSTSFTFITKDDLNVASNPVGVSISYNAKPPVLSAYPAKVSKSFYTFSGSKGIGAGIWVNNVQVVPFNTESTWEYKVTLKEGDNHFTFASGSSFGIKSPMVAATIHYEKPSTDIYKWMKNTDTTTPLNPRTIPKIPASSTRISPSDQKKIDRTLSETGKIDYETKDGVFPKITKVTVVDNTDIYINFSEKIILSDYKQFAFWIMEKLNPENSLPVEKVIGNPIAKIVGLKTAKQKAGTVYLLKIAPFIVGLDGDSIHGGDGYTATFTGSGVDAP
ncbi:hypothetical protein COY07_03290 [Candidatus Peregrinibacteria bacterium CG_4_10_14_0_2_um_filter_43_11]|nr:MAG: hypothetical protein COY07_03290 [Candidatus Peregrinibacteria bacterium CG_4_10_14_0_2_um_filter_43_11]